jgi:hypothetical protein
MEPIKQAHDQRSDVREGCNIRGESRRSRVEPRSEAGRRATYRSYTRPRRGTTKSPSNRAILEMIRSMTAADLVGLAAPIATHRFTLMRPTGSRVAAYENRVIACPGFILDSDCWAASELSWCMVDHVVPGAPHALFTPVAGGRSPTIVLMVANFSLGRPFRERHASLVGRLAAHPDLAQLADECRRQLKAEPLRPESTSNGDGAAGNGAAGASPRAS